ncbi:MAG: type III PLP-dependent enzyme, partial [Candidatus Parcubacteria bacterium]|nr:type III PLP-dependent enzyme [Candidatus Parcubacteria bacterium]
MIQKIQEKFDINKLPKPAMIIDSSLIKDKFFNLQNLIEGVGVYYAVKTNSHIEIIRLLNALGSGFEISSLQELRDMINLGIPADKIISGNTFKTPEFIEAAYKYGVNYFAFDSEHEIDKLAELAPGANVSLRVTVDNTGSEWPLSKKFGAPMSKALEL